MEKEEKLKIEVKHFLTLEKEIVAAKSQRGNSEG